ncbi:1514_t:CDS:2 [Entrophospora sp. SA101]|nr:1514_t:CDS:2 [Entrophospora sp. SA101]
MKIIFLSKNDITLRKLPSHVQLAIKLGAIYITEGSVTYSNDEILIAISKLLKNTFRIRVSKVVSEIDDNENSSNNSRGNGVEMMDVLIDEINETNTNEMSVEWN